MANDWKPAQSPLLTRFAADVDPTNPHPEYPRPQMIRRAWMNLNGLWDYAIATGEFDGQFPRARGQILVPFPIESSLSGVGKKLDPEQTLVYRRSFQCPAAWKGKTILLHFQAVNYQARIWLNGVEVGAHKGGFDPFSFDITDTLKPGENDLIVSAQNPLDTGFQPRGKQVRKSEGIMYTGSSGIWQTAWIEPVSSDHLVRSWTTTDLASKAVTVSIVAAGKTAKPWSAELYESRRLVGKAEAKPGEKSVVVTMPDLRPWSPQDPHLYTLKITYGADKVESKVALREIGLTHVDGHARIHLNGKVVTMLTTLDQGYWPDGQFTPPTEKALIDDIIQTKKLGFNSIRKHVKVEPATWYAACDRLGVLVWQDMPSPFFPEGTPPDTAPTKEAAEDFRKELGAMIDHLRCFGSIVVWVPFNEGWGQHETVSSVQWLSSADDSRLIDNASGWTDMGVGDLNDIHHYPEPKAPTADGKRACVLGEFGGIGRVIAGRTWVKKKNWGYIQIQSKKALDRRIAEYFDTLQLLKKEGLCAAVYTQTTDVEQETNGLLTYDRAVVKVSRGAFAALAKRFIGEDAE